MQYNLQQNPEIFQNIHALPGSKRNLWKIIQTTQTTTKNLIEKEVLQVFGPHIHNYLGVQLSTNEGLYAFSFINNFGQYLSAPNGERVFRSIAFHSPNHLIVELLRGEKFHFSHGNWEKWERGNSIPKEWIMENIKNMPNRSEKQ